MIVGIPEPNNTRERPRVGIATVWVTYYAHRLGKVVHIDDKQSQPGIEGPTVVIDPTLGPRQPDRVAVECGRCIGDFTQQHVVAVDVLLTPRLVLRRVLVEVVAAERILRERLSHDREGLGG